MKNTILYTLLLLFTAFMLLNPLSAGNLPSVVIKDLEGKDVDIKKYAENGKITLITFWATWCIPCKKELDNLSNLLESWENEFNMELVAISIDNARNSYQVRPYVSGKGWHFDVLLDANEDTKRAFNFATIPFSILLDQEGNIVYRHVGYSEGDEYIIEEIMMELL